LARPTLGVHSTLFNILAGVWEQLRGKKGMKKEVKIIKEWQKGEKDKKSQV